MDSSELLKSITFNLSSVAYCKVGAEWNYKNIISSFSRLYLVTAGEAHIFTADKKIHLKKGHLYLVPSFTPCSYTCKDEMTHFYATFTIQLPNHLSIYQLFNFSFEIEATDEHYAYFKQLWKANPNMELPAKDPNIYQRLNSRCWNHGLKDVQRSLASSGLLYLLLSKFIGAAKIDFGTSDSGNILSAVTFIHSHLNENLAIEELANMVHLSPAHFTRKFKQLTHLTPRDYINTQRIEKAQLLLNTTSQSCIEIAELCGYKSNAYFCKIFKKYIGKSPREYRNNQV
ncbi:AraC family transcriptional regulator [uncultured Draconibacterium sp.]|uniref:AraC family transcriptional regulator n=1 Tax=uncultured Draconibacterium sp. TaxID=1573823 RepID=UPI00326063EB